MKKIAYKGFDKDMKCQGMQYEEGKTYKAEGEIKVCENGFHACENPLDVLRYYHFSNGCKYHVVECDGIVYDKYSLDSEFACCEITVGKELSYSELIKAGLDAIFEKKIGYRGIKYEPINRSIAAINRDFSFAAANGDNSIATARGDVSVAATRCGFAQAIVGGNYSIAAAEGFCSTATTLGLRGISATLGESSTASTHGDRSMAMTQGALSIALARGSYSAAVANGKESIAFANGRSSRAKASLGSYIVLTEHDPVGGLKDCQCRKVDGEKIKPDTFYKLVCGEFVEAEE